MNMNNLKAFREHWKTADDFYLERDNRTALEVGNLVQYAARPIEIRVDPHAAHTSAVQEMALLACNLTARWARRVCVVVPSVELTDRLVRDGHHSLADRILAEMYAADPFGDFSINSSGAEYGQEDKPFALRLFIGPWAEVSTVPSPVSADDYFINAFSWAALGRRSTGFSGTITYPATAAATALAASLGVADLFKRAINQPRVEWLPNFAWCTWTQSLRDVDYCVSTAYNYPVPGRLDLARTLLAGVGAIGSALLYIADFMHLDGHLTLLDRDKIELSNLNRSPLFTIRHVIAKKEKTAAARAYLTAQPVNVRAKTGTWHEYGARLAEEPFDLWVSLTNEDAAWAVVPFQLPPVVLHGTTTSGWGFSAGRHIPRKEDCTLCRLPHPTAEFRGPCAEGEIAVDPVGPPVRASLPFLSTGSAALVLAEMLKLSAGINAETDAATIMNMPNDIAADLRYGLPAVITLKRPSNSSCRGCRTANSPVWESRGGRSLYCLYSVQESCPADEAA
jgi:ThiF family